MADTPKRTAQSKKQVLHVHCPRPFFRRGGRDFIQGKNVVALDELTDEQIEAIKAETMLAVTEHTVTDETQG